MRPAHAAAVLGLAACGCGGAARDLTTIGSARVPALPPDVRPVPAGRGPRYQLPAVSAPVARRAPVAGMSCSTKPRPAYGVFVELLADRRVLVLPAGIGISPPQRGVGAYVSGGACSYPIATHGPTGVTLVDRGVRTPSLSQLFAIWGQRLSPKRLAGFGGRVLAFVAGRRWRGQPGAIPLHRHAVIVLEVGGEIPPHPHYDFPPGL